MKKFNKLFYSGLSFVLLFSGILIAILGSYISSSYSEDVIFTKDQQNIFHIPVVDTVANKPTKNIESVKPKPRKKVMVIDTTHTIINSDTTQHEKHI